MEESVWICRNLTRFWITTQKILMSKFNQGLQDKNWIIFWNLMVFGFPLIQVRIYLLPHLFTQNYSHNQQLGIFKKTPHCAKNYLHNQQLGILKKYRFFTAIFFYQRNQIKLYFQITKNMKALLIYSNRKCKIILGCPWLTWFPLTCFPVIKE